LEIAITCTNGGCPSLHCTCGIDTAGSTPHLAAGQLLHACINDPHTDPCMSRHAILIQSDLLTETAEFSHCMHAACSMVSESAKQPPAGPHSCMRCGRAGATLLYGRAAPPPRAYGCMYAMRGRSTAVRAVGLWRCWALLMAAQGLASGGGVLGARRTQGRRPCAG
jgi:hypothetical protein